MAELPVKHVAYQNGVIREAGGSMIAFYDAEAKELSISGFVRTYFAEDIEAAMEIVGRLCD